MVPLLFKDLSHRFSRQQSKKRLKTHDQLNNTTHFKSETNSYSGSIVELFPFVGIRVGTNTHTERFVIILNNKLNQKDFYLQKD
ncbi:hypothetical protein BpHYR1_029880 [Brachionus plicatilis]|uniref:Uncharacterized protein n=1 Tax=Brachionus plicatilis TaxID=10195 RepID=A0A3M7PLF5_BRAPC|nr:hypothetical protein BpHYR1_029880 [Brachionus plicatilis]